MRERNGERMRSVALEGKNLVAAPYEARELGREALALLALLLLAGCAGPATVEDPALDDVTAAVPTERARQTAVDEAERRLDGEGGEDDDALVAQALSMHGLDQPSVDLFVARGLRGALLEVAPLHPKADAGALYAAALARWHEVAMLPAARRLQMLGALAGFDSSSTPVVCDPRAAQSAAQTPERGLDAREHRLVAAARALVAAAISAHADLPAAEATAALGPVETRVSERAARAALPFANTRCASATDPALAAARALRMGWQSFTDEGIDDLAWPAVAALLGRPLPPAPAPARPALELVDPAGLSCAVLPTGLFCDGAANGSPLQISVADRQLSVPLKRGQRPAAALGAVRSALPAGLASCASGSPATLLRLDQRAPSLEGTALDSVTLEAAGTTAAASDAARPRPPRELHVHGRFKSAGTRPAFLADFSGCELRIELIAQRVAGAPREFDARIKLSSRLPTRSYEALLTDELGRTLAAADAN